MVFVVGCVVYRGESLGLVWELIQIQILCSHIVLTADLLCVRACVAGLDHQGHGRRCHHPGGGSILRPPVLLRDSGPAHAHREDLAAGNIHAHQRNQLLFKAYQDEGSDDAGFFYWISQNPPAAVAELLLIITAPTKGYLVYAAPYEPCWIVVDLEGPSFAWFICMCNASVKTMPLFVAHHVHSIIAHSAIHHQVVLEMAKISLIECELHELNWFFPIMPFFFEIIYKNFQFGFHLLKDNVT